MTIFETLTLSGSFLALAVSLWTLFRTSRMSSYEIRLARRLELHALLQDADRARLQDPSLDRMFRSSHSKGRLPSRNKQETYVAIYMNVFEAAYSVFRETKGLSRAEMEVEQAWDRFLDNFLRDCIPAIEIWDEYRATYYESFQTFVDEKIARISAEQATRPVIDQGVV